MCRCAAMPEAGTVWNGFRCALAIIRGRIIFNSAMPERLRTLRHCIQRENHKLCLWENRAVALKR